MKISGENLTCKGCGHQVAVLVISPIAKGEFLTCKDCAIEAGIYCQRHDLVHQGFIDDTSACLACIEEMVWDELKHAAAIRRRVFGALKKDVQENLEEWLQISSKITEDSKDVCLLRAVASLAKRRGTSLEEAVRQIEVTQDWRAAL